MITCGCGTFVRPATSCPHCGAPPRVRAGTAALLLGLAVACTGDAKTTDSGTPDHTGFTAQPAYGISTTSTDGTTMDDGYTTDETDADTDVDTDTDSGSGHTGGGGSGATTGGSGDALHSGRN